MKIKVTIEVVNSHGIYTNYITDFVKIIDNTPFDKAASFVTQQAIEKVPNWREPYESNPKTN